MELYSIFFVRSRPAAVGVLKKELDDWKRKIDSSAVESALSSLQMVISRPAAFFDTCAVIAALDTYIHTCMTLFYLEFTG